MTIHSPLRIMMTADAVGGVWTYAASLSSALAAAGCEVHLVTMGPRPRADQRAMLRDSRIRLIETDLALEWQDPGGKDVPRAQWQLALLESEIRPDIVHLNSFREASFAWTAPVLVVAHSCVNSWASACADKDWLQQPEWRRYTKNVADGLDHARVWVSPSQSFHDVIRAVYAPRSPGVIIHNGLSSGLASDWPKQPFVLAAGRVWDRAKNIAVLSKAATVLDWPVRIAGPAAKDSPEANGFDVLGELPRSALLHQMHRAAIFASPARYEPFGLAVLEAASAGCALVLSDIPTFRELWSGAACFVPSSDGNAWRAALSELCGDNCRRIRLQRAARELSRHYSLAYTAEAYQILYRNLAASDSCAASIKAREVYA
jgi:glycosyltransferase involved in cell wall biosynthesis